MARLSTGDAEAALDIVQDAMLKLVKKYGRHSSEEWPGLFYRILGNTVTDWHRQQQRRWKLFDRWFGSADQDDEANNSRDTSAIDRMPAAESLQPLAQLSVTENMQRVTQAIQQLTPRQQQAFMLRCWQGFSTHETADIMGCSAGTVKTLYSRAMHAVRQRLIPSE
jgi:RNA polymerase sigma-70 factor (ECF subfamily)